MSVGPILELRTFIFIDLQWNGDAEVRRELQVVPDRPGAVLTDNLVIGFIVNTRDIIGPRVIDDTANGRPQIQTASRGSETEVKIWPGFGAIDSPYKMSVMYTHCRFAVSFGVEEIVYGIENVQAATHGLTSVASRQTFHYCILMPPRKRLLWVIPNFLNQIKCITDAPVRRHVKGRDQLEWRLVLERNDPSRRLFYHYTQIQMGFIKQLLGGFIVFALASVYAHYQPEMGNFLAKNVVDPVIKILLHP
jgi:hypothetical protein